MSYVKLEISETVLDRYRLSPRTPVTGTDRQGEGVAAVEVSKNPRTMSRSAFQSRMFPNPFSALVSEHGLRSSWQNERLLAKKPENHKATFSRV
jgi:hypothetical protein